MRHRRPRAAALAAAAACFLAALAAVEGRREVETDASLEQELDARFAVEAVPFASFVAVGDETASASDVRAERASASDRHVASEGDGASGGGRRTASADDKASASGLRIAAAEDKSSDKASARAGAAAARSAGKLAGTAGAARHLVALAVAAFHKAERGSAPGLLAECDEDSRGERLGCKAGSGGCGCRWFERCYPKREKGGHRDVGVCSPGVAVLVAASLAIISSAVGCVVVLRVFFQWRERIRALMSKGLHGESGHEEEDEDEPADTKSAGGG